MSQHVTRVSDLGTASCSASHASPDPTSSQTSPSVAGRLCRMSEKKSARASSQGWRRILPGVISDKSIVIHSSLKEWNVMRRYSGAPSPYPSTHHVPELRKRSNQHCTTADGDPDEPSDVRQDQQRAAADHEICDVLPHVTRSQE